jgi:hypothetical protein
MVEGATGKIVNKEGPNNEVAQNMMYMYKHVQGKVFDGKFSLE